MQNFEDIDIERQIHDSMLLDQTNRKEKLVNFISKKFSMRSEQLENNKALIDVIMQLIRESNPMIYEYNEDIWNFLAINIEAEDNEISAIFNLPSIKFGLTVIALFNSDIANSSSPLFW